MEKWIIDLAMVINLFNIIVCHRVSKGMTCHQSGVMRWRFDQEVIQTSLHLRKTPRPYKCQTLSLVNEMNEFKGISACK